MMQRIRTTPFQTNWQWGKQACALIFCTLLLLGMLGIPQPACAAIQEIRVLATIKEKNQRVAIENAMVYAKKRAVYLVARKMDLPNVTQALLNLRPDQWKEIVRGATVLQSRREGDITYADIAVTVVEEPLHRALNKDSLGEHAVILSDAEGTEGKFVRGVLVLPVYITHARPYLWEAENILRAPLTTEMLRQSRGAAMLPSGDFDDLRLVDYQNVLTVKPEELAEMFVRYGAEEIIIAILTPSERGTMQPSNILLRRLTKEGIRVEEMNISHRNATESLEDRVEDAAAAIASAATHIATATAEKEQQAIASAPKIAIRFGNANPRELADLQGVLRKTPGILHVAIPRISLQRTEGELSLSDTPEQVKKALKAKGVYVVPEEKGWWVSFHPPEGRRENPSLGSAPMPRRP